MRKQNQDDNQGKQKEHHKNSSSSSKVIMNDDVISLPDWFCTSSTFSFEGEAKGGGDKALIHKDSLIDKAFGNNQYTNMLNLLTEYYKNRRREQMKKKKICQELGYMIGILGSKAPLSCSTAVTSFSNRKSNININDEDNDSSNNYDDDDNYGGDDDASDDFYDYYGDQNDDSSKEKQNKVNGKQEGTEETNYFDVNKRSQVLSILTSLKNSAVAAAGEKTINRQIGSFLAWKHSFPQAAKALEKLLLHKIGKLQVEFSNSTLLPSTSEFTEREQQEQQKQQESQKQESALAEYSNDLIDKLGRLKIVGRRTHECSVIQHINTMDEYMSTTIGLPNSEIKIRRRFSLLAIFTPPLSSVSSTSLAGAPAVAAEEIYELYFKELDPILRQQAGTSTSGSNNNNNNAQSDAAANQQWTSSVSWAFPSSKQMWKNSGVMIVPKIILGNN